MLRDVIQRGTGTRAKALGRTDVGGKTGTTNEMKHAWFAGFHPTQVSIVWVGFDQPSTLGRGEYGGVAALPIWVDYMRTALKSVPYQWVSVNNKAKSETAKQEVINLSDDNDNTTAGATGSGSDARITNQKVTDGIVRPPRASLIERQPPKPVEPPKPVNSNSNSSTNADTSSTRAAPKPAPKPAEKPKAEPKPTENKAAPAND